MRKWTTGFFLVPLSGLVATSGFAPHVTSSPAMTLASAAGLAAGLAWQLLDRKDVADRLTWLAALFAIGVFLQMLSSVSPGSVELHLPVLLFGFGAVSGVVLSESYLRRRRPDKPAKEDVVPATESHSER